MATTNLINSANQIEKSNEWSKNPLTDGKLIRTAKKGNAMDWTAKAMQDDVLAKETQTTKRNRPSPYTRRENHGI
jgi:hypothetical protein